jgi:hypothetical protein
MVLPGYVLMDQGTQVHVGAWPGGSGSRQVFLSQAFASQGACYVICAAGLERPDDQPEEYRELICGWDGQSCIIDPWGNIIAGPVEGEAIITAPGSLDTIRTAKAVCDVAGHYSRPDVFTVKVNRQSHRRVIGDPETATTSNMSAVALAKPVELIELNGAVGTSDETATIVGASD